jgi:hypothetical protein
VVASAVEAFPLVVGEESPVLSGKIVPSEGVGRDAEPRVIGGVATTITGVVWCGFAGPLASGVIVRTSRVVAEADCAVITVAGVCRPCDVSEEGMMALLLLVLLLVLLVLLVLLLLVLLLLLSAGSEVVFCTSGSDPLPSASFPSASSPLLPPPGLGRHGPEVGVEMGGSPASSSATCLMRSRSPSLSVLLNGGLLSSTSWMRVATLGREAWSSIPE